MKPEFKKYKQYEVQQAEQNISKNNKQLIEKYILFCGSTAGEKKLQNIKRVMIKVIDVLECDLNKLDLDIIRNFLNVLKKSELAPATKNEIKKYLKRYIKEFYEDWNKQFKGLKDFKLENDINQNKINAQTILRKEDIKRLIRGTDSIKYKALIMLLYETAARPQEVLGIRWKDVNFEDKDIKLKSSKTGNTRVLLVNETIPHLKRYKEEAFENPKADDFIFPTGHNKFKAMSYISIDVFIKNLGKRVLNKPIFPYLIRHSRLTELQKKLPAKLYEKFADHSIQTATRYSHLDKEDLSEILRTNVYDIKELTESEKKSYDKEIAELKKKYKEFTEFVESKFVEGRKNQVAFFNKLSAKEQNIYRKLWVMQNNLPLKDLVETKRKIIIKD